jgi:signal transduction histidine kinase
VQSLVDCAPTLDSFVAEVEEGLAFLRRTGNEQIRETLDSYRWLAAVLRDERAGGAGEAVPIDRYAGNPPSLLIAHLTRAIVAAIFGEPADLAAHTAAAMPLLPAVPGNYATAQAEPLRALALAGQVRAGHGAERDALLSELDDVMRRLAARAADAPANFRHLLRLVEAERAWAVGDFRAALLAYDAAQSEVADRRRPWHRALIAERAARFFLAHGVDHAGQRLLADARREYLAWGATAKVEQLDWAHTSMRTQIGAYDGDRSVITTGTIDLLGILSGSQALSSETSVERLHARIVEVLGALTGATGVHLLLWSEDRRAWLLPAPVSAGGMIAVSETSHEHPMPMSVLRYAERTREPLVVADATVDDRFSRDPYFADFGCCSVLVVPILSRGTLRAALLLENRFIRGAFTTKRLDAVKLVAGQLAVSLDNAQLYAELMASRARIVASADQARRRMERDLHDGAQQRFVHTIVVLEMARRALAGVEGPGPQLVEEALANAERANEELRELAHGIHPGILSSGGLGTALEALARRSAIPVTVDLRTDARLPEHIEVTAYFVVSEALTNAAKHANASTMHVTVETSDGDARLTVSDDGVGGADPTRGSGLVGLKDRVEAIGGTLTVDSRLGQGTRLHVELPLDPNQPTRSR